MRRHPLNRPLHPTTSFRTSSLLALSHHPRSVHHSCCIKQRIALYSGHVCCVVKQGLQTFLTQCVSPAAEPEPESLNNKINPDLIWVKNKGSDKSVKLQLLGKYDQWTARRTEGQTGSQVGLHFHYCIELTLALMIKRVILHSDILCNLNETNINT